MEVMGPSIHANQCESVSVGISDEEFRTLLRSVWGPPLPEPATEEERIQRAWGEVSAAAGVANAVIEQILADLRSEGLSEEVCGRILSVGECYGVEARPSDNWSDYLDRLGWVLALIAEPGFTAHGNC